MPQLNNPRYERFAQGIARGLSQHAAYKHAGYSPNRLPKAMRSEASKLAKKPEVATRIAELQHREAHRTGVTVDALLAELDRMLKIAMQIKAPSAGVSAIMGKAKLLGLVIEKHEVEGSVIRKPSRQSTDAKTMSLEEWKQKFSPPAPPEETLQ